MNSDHELWMLEREAEARSERMTELFRIVRRAEMQPDFYTPGEVFRAGHELEQHVEWFEDLTDGILRPLGMGRN